MAAPGIRELNLTRVSFVHGRHPQARALQHEAFGAACAGNSPS
jgi:hypothetical protein